MKSSAAGLLLLASAALAALVSGCADAKAVNAAFSQSRVTWYVFDPGQETGLRDLPGFEQPQTVTWVPRPQAVRATDLAAFPENRGSVAVAHLGLLVLDDSSGTLEVLRPGSLQPLAPYRTDRLFVWKDKLFLTLTQEASGTAPPASLVWWAPGQPRVAPHPLPSQVRDPGRQAVAVELSPGDSSAVTFTWRRAAPDGWTYERTVLTLADGREAPAPAPEAAPRTAPDPAYGPTRARLAERLGAEVPATPALGAGPLVLFTADGWVAVSRPGDPTARLYRLPELGAAGRYTGAVCLARGFVFTWETAYRGYAGASGLVHVPATVLAP